ncbi:MAG: hypothetical protein KAG56_04975 [Sulfurovaceae bacterium]|nr:hypothetical protein [Sulfurovaceae bacterium]
MHKVNYKKNIDYLDTLLISLILSTVTLPFLWLLSGESISWVVSCVTLWAIGVFTVFHPFTRYIFPMMLTKAGTFVLSAILGIFTIWVNLNILFYILPVADIELIFNQNLFRGSLASTAMFVWFYILIAGTVVANLSLRLDTIVKNHQKLMQTIKRTSLFEFNLFKHYSELLLLFILPIALIFWTEITFSTRVLLSIISMSMGVGFLIQRLNIELLKKRVITSMGILFTVMLINISFVNIFGVEMIPSNSLKVRIAGDTIRHNLESISIKHPSYQINSAINRDISLYKIVSSVPQIGLHIGYRIATVPNETIVVKATQEQYTVENQYQERLFTIQR